MPLETVTEFSPEQEPTLGPRRVYVALHDRKKDEFGEFHWAIVTTTPGGMPTYYHASNTNAADPANGTWSFERRGVGDTWDFRRTRSLLVLYELGTLPRGPGFSKDFARIDTICRDTPTPSNGRNLTLKEGQRFSCQTWALDVVERLFLAGYTTMDAEGVEEFGSEAARAYREELEDAGNSNQNGRFKIVKQKYE
ncbi:hypothetical protein DL765_004681 [Monosporascus sp. GIB2]|nr:hypothetical protein DL765_004681 [Monosporascus sp. GIB2]